MLIILVVLVVVVAFLLLRKYRKPIKRAILDRLSSSSEPGQRKSHGPEQRISSSEFEGLTAEESKRELARLQAVIEDRKQVARDTDISHHLWGLYKRLLRYFSPDSTDRYIQDGRWYDVKIHQVSTLNGLNEVEFELKGARYRFIDDEEKQGWRLNLKSFSLFLYDDSGHCLIEIPMKMRVDSSGRNYAVESGGPRAFIPGGWVNDFINVKLKHQRIQNQEIRAQKHQERLCEIEDLKDRFGILD